MIKLKAILMAVAMLPINQFSTKYNENLAPYFCAFDLEETPSPFVITQGTGLAEIQPTGGVIGYGKGMLSLWSPSTSGNFEVNAGNKMDFYMSADDIDYYLLSINIKHNFQPTDVIDVFLKIKVYQQNVLVKELTISKNDAPDWNNFYSFFETLPAFQGDTLSFSFELPQVSPALDRYVIIDGFKIEASNNSNSFPSTYSLPTSHANIMPVYNGDYILRVEDNGFSKKQFWVKVLKASATLDFPNTNSGTYNDLTIPLTGAMVGDIVEIGTTVLLTGGQFNAFVSTNGVVTVRFTNNTASAIDPPSGDFKIRIQ